MYMYGKEKPKIKAKIDLKFTFENINILMINGVVNIIFGTKNSMLTAAYNAQEKRVLEADSSSNVFKTLLNISSKKVLEKWMGEKHKCCGNARVNIKKINDGR
jgi:hypothetical protein